ncbi:MAG: Rieske 2Fe-2S domain-containing protein [bacterium]
MGAFQKAAKKQDVEVGQGVVCEIDGKSIALFNVAGDYYAINNLCPHRGGPLGEGELDGCLVTCPWHAWQFDVKAGCNADNPEEKIVKYNVKVEGDDVLVEI